MSDWIFQWKTLKYERSNWWRSIDPTMDTDSDVCVSGDQYKCQEIDIFGLDIVIVYLYYYV